MFEVMIDGFKYSIYNQSWHVQQFVYPLVEVLIGC